MSIPKPASLHFSTLQHLHHAMMKTHPDRATFDDFKHWIRFYATHMDPMKLKKHYSVEAWADFLDKILLVEPQITLYESYWPVEAYFNTYMVNRRRLPRYKHDSIRPRRKLKNAAMAPEIFYDDDFENAGPSISKQSLNIGDAQQSMSCSPSRTRFSFSKSSDAHLVGQFRSRLGNMASRSATLSRSQGPEWCSINANANSPSTTAPTLVQGYSDTKETLVVTCCGNTTTVKPIFNQRLVNFVGNVDLLSNLAKLGIFLDQHLDELLHLKHDDLMKFFSDVVSDMTPMTKLQFVKCVQVESSNIRNRQTLHSSFISCPPLESQLTDSCQLDKGLFQMAMKLEDNDFKELMNAMETMSQDYISIYRPNADQLYQVVTAIYLSCDLLNKYEDLWPLRIFLKYRSTSVRTCPLYSERQAEVIFSKVFKNQSHRRLPTLVQLPCQLHPLIDISQIPHTLKTRLYSLGIAGLISALAFVGVQSDAQFADFCKLNDQEMDDLFILGKLQLSQFQRFTLRLALSSAK